MKRTDVVFCIMALALVVILIAGIGYYIGHFCGICYAMDNIRAVPVDEHVALLDISHNLLSYTR